MNAETQSAYISLASNFMRLGCRALSLMSSILLVLYYGRPLITARIIIGAYVTLWRLIKSIEEISGLPKKSIVRSIRSLC